MLIGTINLHGGMFFELDLLRLPKGLKNNYKNEYATYLKNGLVSMLNNNIEKEYDILACQEMPYGDKYFLKIQEELKLIGYKIYPERDYFRNAKCISTFIVKSDLDCKSVDLEMGREFKNKFSKILAGELEIVNVHSPSDRNACMQIVNKLDSNKKIILLGDFNAARDEQVKYPNKRKKGISDEHKNFLEGIEKGKFNEIGDDNQYTYITSKVHNKIDHVFFSKGLVDYLEEKCYSLEVNLNKNVNFWGWEDQEYGFTDHSMLEFNINLKY